MVMKTKLLLIAIILFSTSSFISNRPVTVFMIGDSDNGQQIYSK